jgi:cytochrome c
VSAKFLVASTVVVLSAALSTAKADGDPTRGAAVYRACVACHSLEPQLNLTGPSLAGLWGKKVASVEDFPRYSKALKAQEFI